MHRTRNSVLCYVAPVLLSAAGLAPLTTQAESFDFDHLKFGAPQGLAAQADQTLCYSSYCVGYSYEYKGPLWSAYALTDQSVEIKQKRSNDFREDTSIPEAHRSTLSDYKGSGYDRGHMAPNAALDWSKQAMSETFLLSNMSPQLPGFNRQGWRYLEEAVRDLAAAEAGHTLYVVTGAHFDDNPETIGSGVAIPSAYYKAIFSTSGIGMAFYVPHQKIGKADLAQTQVSIDELEALLGIDLFERLPDDIESVAESM